MPSSRMPSVRTGRRVFSSARCASSEREQSPPVSSRRVYAQQFIDQTAHKMCCAPLPTTRRHTASRPPSIRGLPTHFMSMPKSSRVRPARRTAECVRNLDMISVGSMGPLTKPAADVPTHPLKCSFLPLREICLCLCMFLSMNALSWLVEL